jgi:hypothetical protein
MWQVPKYVQYMTTSVTVDSYPLLLFLISPPLRAMRRYLLTVDRHTTRTSLLQFGALLAMMLLPTMALSLLRLLPAPPAM